MLRLFIGIRPPAPVRDALLDAMEGIENARWQDDDQLHLTLRFVGEVSEDRADDLVSALARIRLAPFPVAISGTGSFEKKGRISAVWAGVEPSAALLALQGKVERACQSVGLPQEGRKYCPHITMARLNRSSQDAREWLSETGLLRIKPFQVKRFVLFESRLTDHGSEYEQIVHFPLISDG